MFTRFGYGVIAGIIAILLLSVGGYYVYTYLKEKPPGWLIEFVTHTEPPAPLPQGELAPLTAPEGFTARIFARTIAGARVMVRDPKGTLLVSETSEGKIIALPDLDTDGQADKTIVLLQGLKQPHGLAFNCPNTGNTSADQDACLLYVAETGAVKSYMYDADTYTANYQSTLAALPTGDGHFTRTLLMNPDGKNLFVSVGSDCNVCDEVNKLRAAVLSLSLGTNPELTTFATGLRNTVFMALDPVTGKVWGTDNGRDLLGDNIPPDEVNIIEQGKNYGWPICYGDKIHDSDFDKKQYFRDPCADSIAPHIKLQAHSAPLALAFIPEEGWPADMRNDLLVAYHGSWNRSVPTGYKIVRFNLDTNRNATGAPIDFLTGFLPEMASKTDDAIGRPVGLLAEPGGVLYVSDDRAGAIYKVQTNMAQ